MTCFISSCVVVKEYEKVNINDPDMILSEKKCDRNVASSGASRSDIWTNVSIGYSHSSDDRNDIWSVNVSIASEYDYFSAGVGGSYTAF